MKQRCRTSVPRCPPCKIFLDIKRQWEQKKERQAKGRTTEELWGRREKKGKKGIILSTFGKRRSRCWLWPRAFWRHETWLCDMTALGRAWPKAHRTPMPGGSLPKGLGAWAVEGSAANFSSQGAEVDQAPWWGSLAVLDCRSLRCTEHAAAAIAKPKHMVDVDVLDLSWLLPAVMELAACCRATWKCTVDCSCVEAPIVTTRLLPTRANWFLLAQLFNTTVQSHGWLWRRHMQRQRDR